MSVVITEAEGVCRPQRTEQHKYRAERGLKMLALRTVWCGHRISSSAALNLEEAKRRFLLEPLEWVAPSF